MKADSITPEDVAFTVYPGLNWCQTCTVCRLLLLLLSKSWTTTDDPAFPRL